MEKEEEKKNLGFLIRWMGLVGNVLGRTVVVYVAHLAVFQPLGEEYELRSLGLC